MSAALQVIHSQIQNIHQFETRESILSLHDEAVARAKNYRRSEKELLQILLQVEQRKLYHQFGLTSLFSYCVDLLHFPGIRHMILSRSFVQEFKFRIYWKLFIKIKPRSQRLGKFVP